MSYLHIYPLHDGTTASTALAHGCRPDCGTVAGWRASSQSSGCRDGRQPPSSVIEVLASKLGGRTIDLVHTERDSEIGTRCPKRFGHTKLAHDANRCFVLLLSNGDDTLSPSGAKACTMLATAALRRQNLGGCANRPRPTAAPPAETTGR
jgi:hypothetical protein